MSIRALTQDFVAIPSRVQQHRLTRSCCIWNALQKRCHRVTALRLCRGHWSGFHCWRSSCLRKSSTKDSMTNVATTEYILQLKLSQTFMCSLWYWLPFASRQKRNIIATESWLYGRGHIASESGRGRGLLGLRLPYLPISYL